jgi:hypothetical protein
MNPKRIVASAAVSGLIGYTLHGNETVQIPLIGSVSAPLGFAVHTAVADYLSGMVVKEDPLSDWVDAKYDKPVDQQFYSYTVAGAGQLALMKGASSNPNVSLGEAFGVGFIAPLVGRELFQMYKLN